MGHTSSCHTNCIDGHCRCWCHKVTPPWKNPVLLSKEGEALKAAMFLADYLSKKQVVLQVTIDLDGIPGWGYHGEDYQKLLESQLKDSVAHYNPVVKIIKNDRPAEMVPTDITMTDEEHVAAGHAFYNDPDGGHWELKVRPKHIDDDYEKYL